MTEQQNIRYSRNSIMPNVGTDGQEVLLKSKVLIIGAGGLGSPAALYLAAAGIGTLGIVDSDVVELSNLQRQVIHTTNTLGIAKAESAKQQIQRLNPDVTCITYQTRFSADNAADLIADYDFIIDATDNFSTKYLINDSCVRAQKPFSHGGIVRFAGQCMTYVPGSACFRCLFDEEPTGDSVLLPAKAGVLGAVAGLIGTIQATEAIKYLLKIGDLLVNRMLFVDALTMEFTSMQLSVNPDCAAGHQ